MAYGRKTGGRKKGVPNKRTRERERVVQEALQKAKEAGAEICDGDAYAVLVAFYKNVSLPMEFRADCAKAVLRFERSPMPATLFNHNTERSYVVRMPQRCSNMDEWLKQYSHLDQQNDSLGRQSAEQRNANPDSKMKNAHGGAGPPRGGTDLADGTERKDN